MPPKKTASALFRQTRPGKPLQIREDSVIRQDVKTGKWWERRVDGINPVAVFSEQDIADACGLRLETFQAMAKKDKLNLQDLRSLVLFVADRFGLPSEPGAVKFISALDEQMLPGEASGST